jgi:murein DD-endopeptidase MepM/ murein hydrolase activator NlpD
VRAAWLAIGALWITCAGAEALYRLPWADGLSFAIVQAPGGRITTHFTKATLNAVDIAMPEGTPIVAAREGIVEALEAHHATGPQHEPLTYEGNYVRVLHADGTVATYAHLRHRGVVVAVGDSVARGQLIAYSGASGDVDEPHLHFGVSRRTVNSAGWQEEISQPVTFYVGSPPMAFAPRAAQRAAADYSPGAALPRAPSEVRLLSWTRPTLEPGEEPAAWAALARWLACGLVALAWFARFAAR